MPYADEYGPKFRIFDYIRTLTPPKNHEESNLMANELSDIRIRIEDEVYSHRVEFPKLSTKSIESQIENVYSHPIGLRDLRSVNKLRFSDGNLISIP
ncbi:hypothetical protein KAM622c_28950 [Klebsiella quasipneumoniae subsp. quasipneumoniae]|nr:hypothetical protein KAM622c_28950 [Klebsiella quasipneumoniae subsp. quasipneumoniae]